LCDGRDAIFIEKIYGISVVFGDTKILFKIFSMRVLMFGWEFPPHISGGLGTACYGLSSGLTSFDDVDLVFVVPKAYGDEPKPKMTLIGASDFELSKEVVSKYLELERSTRMEFQHQQVSAYITPEQYERLIQEEDTREKNFSQSESAAKLPFTGKYGGSLFDEISRYGIVASAIARKEPHDIIHAHDWLTYPAGIAAKEVSGKPLVVHVHATEFDRSGENINEKVYAIERKGMEVADRVITVSNLTRNIVIQRYGINPSKVITVYNAVDGVDNYTINQLQRVKAKGKVVTFLGRITMQKGPEYFVEAANEVLKKKDDDQFVMAGSGDMMNRMIKLVAKKGIADRFFFPGFLRGEDVFRMFAMSDLYVMPSVSEPFGISPLEAMQSNVPVIISKQSGVSELIKNAIKIDFWDIEAMSNAIYGVLTYGALAGYMQRNGKKEVDKLKWCHAARQVRDVYCSVL